MKKKYHSPISILVENFECSPGQIWLFDPEQGQSCYCLITSVEKTTPRNPSSEYDGIYHEIYGITFDKKRGFMFSESLLFPLSINFKKTHMYWKLVA